VALRAPGVPKGTYVSRVTASKTGEGAALLTFDGHRGGDNSVYVFATSDYGENWKAIHNGIPDSAGTVHVVREHPGIRISCLLGRSLPVVSCDRGANWTALKNNFPTVPVDDIESRPRKRPGACYSRRSIWVFDDLTPIEKMDANVTASPLTFSAADSDYLALAQSPGVEGKKRSPQRTRRTAHS